MPRQASSGTPSRSRRLAPPTLRFARPGLALLAGGALALILLAAHAAGQRRVLSPGPLAGTHAPMDARCQDCHVPRRGVADERCLRCHEPLGGGRLGHRAHVDLAKGHPDRPAAAEELRCVACHVDHRGRAQRLAVAGGSQCVGCHFRSLADHPEFAVLATRAVEEPGLHFSHALHVREVGRVKGASGTAACLLCHEARLEGRELAHVAFDRHCASCHAAQGSLGAVAPLPLDDVAAPESMSPGGARAEDFERGSGMIGKRSLRHRDPWVLLSLRRLRHDLDPQKYADAVRSLAGRRARLTAELERAAVVALDLEDLLARETQIRRELREADGRTRTSLPGQAGPNRALRERSERAAELARVAAEIALRQAGTPPARVALVSAHQGLLRQEIEALDSQRSDLGEAPAETALSPEARARKAASLEVLAAACKKCHVLSDGALAPVMAARPILGQARFSHRPHLLQLDCEACHAGGERSQVASDVNLTGIESCRECHSSAGVRQDCDSCHRYHPAPRAPGQEGER